MACGCSGSVDASAGLTAAARNAQSNGATAMPRYAVTLADGSVEVFPIYVDAVRFRMRNPGSEVSELR